MYKQSTSEPSNQKSPFVELEIPGQEKVMIRKRTAVWLFQDTERLSADRLFRVRANQPFSNKPKQVIAKQVLSYLGMQELWCHTSQLSHCTIPVSSSDIPSGITQIGHMKIVTLHNTELAGLVLFFVGNKVSFCFIKHSAR